MLPITIAAARKIADLLSADRAIEHQVLALADQSGMAVPVIPVSQVYVSLAPAGMAGLEQERGLPRITIFSSRLRNGQIEKFRAVSGSVSATAEIAATSDRIEQVGTWIHFYAEAIGTILQQNLGNWGDGLFFSGKYDVEVQPPEPAASGFVQLARVNLEIGVSRD